MENRRKPAPTAATLDINCDCKETMIDYLKNAFPTQQMHVFATSDGSLRSEPMRDEAGNMVECAEALATRDALIEELCAMPPVPAGTHIIWSEIMENRRKPAPTAATLDINCDCKEAV